MGAVSQTLTSSYYKDKLDILADIFGTTDVGLEDGRLVAAGTSYPIVNDVIILVEPSKYSPFVRSTLGVTGPRSDADGFAEDEQRLFSEEWTRFSRVLPDHARTFGRYFDLVDLDTLGDKRVCDLGCGNGRWSWFLKDACRELILVDFSDGIFAARENLRDADNCLFFMGDVTDLPFADDFVDLIVCLGVLHYLATPALTELRKLQRLAPQQLYCLYYALDNRPVFHRLLLRVVTALRLSVSRVESQSFRKLFSRAVVALVYLPLLTAGRALERFGAADRVPLYEGYRDNRSLRVLEQNAYNRFFNRIEQRVSRREVEALRDSFMEVVISEHMPYWHFLCRR
jgi:ubiquinone/menaquinone biosynthesis C-methylase UbiE